MLSMLWLDHTVNAHRGFHKCEGCNASEVDVVRCVLRIFGGKSYKGLSLWRLADVLDDDIVVSVDVV